MHKRHPQKNSIVHAGSIDDNVRITLFETHLSRGDFNTWVKSRGKSVRIMFHDDTFGVVCVGSWSRRGHSVGGSKASKESEEEFDDIHSGYWWLRKRVFVLGWKVFWKVEGLFEINFLAKSRCSDEGDWIREIEEGFCRLAVDVVRCGIKWENDVQIFFHTGFSVLLPPLANDFLNGVKTCV